MGCRFQNLISSFFLSFLAHARFLKRGKRLQSRVIDMLCQTIFQSFHLCYYPAHSNSDCLKLGIGIQDEVVIISMTPEKHLNQLRRSMVHFGLSLLNLDQALDI